MSEATPIPVLNLDSDFLVFLIDGGRAFTNPVTLLEDLDGEVAVKAVEGSPHTIAAIVSHLDYWQNWFMKGVEGRLEPYPESLSNTFFPIEATEWQNLKTNFLETQNTIKTLCKDAELLKRQFSMGQSVGGGHDERSVGMTLMYSVILHNAHHYGQIITLRQTMNLWPPVGGGIS